MNIPYKICFCVFLALIPPVLFLGARSTGAEPVVSSAGFAALIVDESADEAGIYKALTGSGISNVLCASTETAFLNDFSAVEAVPLNDYFKRIEDYDPRNDGYAAKALQIFVSGGKRRLYLPSGGFAGLGQAVSKERILRILGDIPFELAAPQYTRSPRYSLAFFALALILFALLIRLHLKRTSDRFLIVYALVFVPSLALLGRAGSGGLAACAVLLALFQILRPPLQRFISGLYFKQTQSTAVQFMAIFEAEAITAGLLCALYAGIALAAHIETAAFRAALCFMPACIAVSYAEATRSRFPRRLRFIYVPIRSESCRVKKFPTLPLPFLCVAAISLIAAQVSENNVVESKPLDFLPAGGITLTQADYQQHIAFQKGFAYRRLTGAGTDPEEDAAPFLRYVVGADGLIESSLPALTGELDFPDSAAFTADEAVWRLNTLVMFLNGSREFTPFIPRAGAAGSLAALVLALALYLPFAVRRHRKKGSFLIYRN